MGLLSYQPIDYHHLSHNNRSGLLERAHRSKIATRRIANIMDKNGLEPLLSLLPIVGDSTMALGLGGYMLYHAHHAGMGTRNMLSIIGWQGIDRLVGLLPVLGDVADFFYHANTKCANMFAEHYEHVKKSI